MIQLHIKKRDLFDNTISASKKDKKEQNLENIKYLMQEYWEKGKTYKLYGSW